MTRNDLYAAAFRYKKAGLWKKLWDTDLFAIQLPNGEFGYISVMGHAGDYCALGLYLGDEGFDSFRIVANTDPRGLDEFQEREFLVQQKCLQFALENRDDLLPEEVEETRAYAKVNGIRLSGKNTFPHFIKYEPGYHPWKIIDTADMDALYQALEVCTLLGEALKTASPEEYGIVATHPSTTQVPLLTVEDGCLHWNGYAPLPPEKEKVYETVPYKNDLGAARVKALPKSKTWETEVIRTPAPVQESPDKTPYYPLLLLIVESEEGFTLPSAILSRDEQHVDEMLNQLGESLIGQGSAPRELRCRDSRTYALLADFCERTGIRLRRFSGKMKMLDEAKKAILDQLAETDSSDELTNMVESVLSLPDDVIQTMPPSLLRQFRNLIDKKMIPDELSELLKAKLKL